MYIFNLAKIIKSLIGHLVLQNQSHANSPANTNKQKFINAPKSSRRLSQKRMVDPNNPSAQSLTALNMDAAPTANSNGTDNASANTNIRTSARQAARNGNGNGNGGNGGGGRRGNTRNFTYEERINFLTIMRDVLPIDGNEWDSVVSQHNQLYAHCDRSIPSLRRKFQELYRKKIPSGDPNMPEDVRLAKHVMYKITEKSEISAGDEEIDAFGAAQDNGGDDEEGEATGEFARPNTEDQDRNLNLDGNNSVGSSVTAGGGSVTAGASVVGTVGGNNATPARNADTNSFLRGLRPTPRRSNTTTASSVSDLIQLQMVQMMEERERRREERDERREERREFMENISLGMKAFFEWQKKD